MHFTYPQKVVFRHCDPAGLVFYPRFLEMINDAVEAMFADLLDWPFETLHGTHAVPTAALNIQFRAPCRHGDHLDYQITIKALGRSSMTLSTRAMAEGKPRLEADHTLVCVDTSTRPVPWPDPIRSKITELLETTS